MIHARTIDCFVQRINDVTQAVIDLKWYQSSGQFLTLFLRRCMQAYLYVGYGQRWIDKSLYCATFELCQAHKRTGASLCESVTTLTASVLIRNETTETITQVGAMTVMGVLEARRHTIERCHVALRGRPSSSFHCQRCRNAAQV